MRTNLLSSWSSIKENQYEDDSLMKNGIWKTTYGPSLVVIGRKLWKRRKLIYLAFFQGINPAVVRFPGVFLVTLSSSESGLMMSCSALQCNTIQAPWSWRPPRLYPAMIRDPYSARDQTHDLYIIDVSFTPLNDLPCPYYAFQCLWSESWSGIWESLYFMEARLSVTY